MGPLETTVSCPLGVSDPLTTNTHTHSEVSWLHFYVLPQMLHLLEKLLSGKSVSEGLPKSAIPKLLSAFSSNLEKFQWTNEGKFLCT